MSAPCEPHNVGGDCGICAMIATTDALRRILTGTPPPDPAPQARP